MGRTALVYEADVASYSRAQEVVDEVEMDVAAITLSYLITQSVRTALSGHYPGHHFLLLLGPSGAVGGTGTGTTATAIANASFLLLFSSTDVGFHLVDLIRRDSVVEAPPQTFVLGK